MKYDLSYFEKQLEKLPVPQARSKSKVGILSKFSNSEHKYPVRLS